MKPNLLIFFFFLYLNEFAGCSLHSPVYHLNQASKLTISQPFTIFCYEGLDKHFINIWNTVFLNLNIDPNDYDVYEGSTPEDVQEAYNEKQTSWTFNVNAWKTKEIKLKPFNHSCVGIERKRNINYEIKLNLIRVDYWKVLQLIVGLSFFYCAENLSQNNLFYYSSGVSIGIFGSVLILVFIISKMFPKKHVMYGFILGGWSVSVFFLKYLYDNLKTFATQYQNFIITYITVTGFISFIICYRFGPVTDIRSKNLIQWTIQGIGLILIFKSSHFQEAMIAIIVLILSAYFFPSSWKANIIFYWKNRFPPERKLLSEEEYYEEGAIETTKALDDLRSFCSSPECNAWKTITKLKNPTRFASFMNGKSHLDDEEILDYETNSRDTRGNCITDDDSDYSE